jgi:hypothetical protein
MSNKVWVIEDSPEHQVSATKVRQTDGSTFEQKSAEQRNPSLAYSLSIIIWGCGQFYNRQWRLGIIFLLFMINFYVFISIVVRYWESIKFTCESNYVDCSGTLLIYCILYLSGLIVWYLNAWQAYLKTKKINARSLKGTRVTLLRVVCSLLMPGWGQLLNGQVKKGLFFQLFALAGLAALPFILTVFLVWPALEASRSRVVIEWIFSISIILLPIILMMWIFNIFDAAMSKDNTRKGPLLRIKNAINRFRYRTQLYGLKNAVFPLIKRTIILTLLLIFCGINYHFVPKKFYLQQLQHFGNRMLEKEMTVIPGIIKKLPHVNLSE